MPRTTPPRTTAAKPVVPTADQKTIAATATTFYHALGANDESKFCPLADAADMKRLLKAKHIPSCANVVYQGKYRADYRAFKITRPTLIIVLGKQATIFRQAITPTSFGGALLRKDSKGKWKVRLYSD